MVVDRRVVHVGPVGLLHFQPLAIGLQPPLEQQLGLVLACRDRAHDVFVETGRQAFRCYVCDEAVFVSSVDETFEVF